jgi:cellulose synthase/poly-beta-1,6-N-acetylglucosamine synthase-like glycosyltransferase
MRCVAIVPARDAAGWIGLCLSALQTAGFEGHDRIVVDDGSVDGTGDVARSLGARVLRSDQNRGAAAARNIAASAADDVDVLFFVDADVVVAPDARDRVIGALADPAVDAVFGAYDTSPDCPGVVSRYRNLLHHFVHVTGPERPGTFWTGCGAVRSETFKRLGGFDTTQRMMEDIEFGMRLVASGGTIKLDPRLRGKHLKSWSVVSMAITDLRDRAVPWSRLMLAEGAMLSNELNMGMAHRLSALLTLALPLSILFEFAVPGFQGAWLAVLAAFMLVNARFLWFLFRTAGARVALAAVPLHLLHYACAAAGFGWVVMTETLPRRLKALFQGRRRSERRPSSGL